MEDLNLVGRPPSYDAILRAVQANAEKIAEWFKDGKGPTLDQMNELLASTPETEGIRAIAVRDRTEMMRPELAEIFNDLDDLL